MNKKGETQTGYLVPMIVALVVLALVVVGIWAISSGKISFWKDIPIPGQQNETIKVESATFRFVVADDVAEYYTGTEWEGFKGKNIDIGNKRVSYDSMIRSFFDYFYSSRGEEIVRIPANQQSVLYSGGEFGGVPILSFNIKGVLKNIGTSGAYSNGNVYGELMSQDTSNKKVYGQVIVNTKGQVFINRVEKNSLELPKKEEYIEQDSSQMLYRELSAKASDYRDRVLRKPVEISWGIVEKGKVVKEESGKFCAEKVVFEGKISLVIRLEKPASGDVC